MTKQTKIKHYTKRDYAAFAYLAPWIIGMLILQLYPFLSSLVYSFCNYKITGTPSFTGLNILLLPATCLPQPPERCLSRKAGIVRCCPWFSDTS